MIPSEREACAASGVACVVYHVKAIIRRVVLLINLCDIPADVAVTLPDRPLAGDSRLYRAEELYDPSTPLLSRVFAADAGVFPGNEI